MAAGRPDYVAEAMGAAALEHIRICDFTGQLAGAGATRWLASFGAEVIRIEDPVKRGRWDILRGSPPFKDERRGIEVGSGFNNHNVNKLGITIDLRSERGRELLAELIPVCDAVTENFAAGVLERMGFGYERLRELREDIVYVSNCGFGQIGPYSRYKSWGPIAQAVSGLTHTSGLPGMPPAGWGYSYMDHTGGYYMAIALLMALWHREQTGAGQWVDLSCSEAGACLHGSAMLDWSVNGRATRSEGSPDSNHNRSPAMAPHNAYPCRGEDNWVVVACRDDRDWAAAAVVIGEDWAAEPRWASLLGRLGEEAELDRLIGEWTSTLSRAEVADAMRAAGVPSAPVAQPGERIDADRDTHDWGLWPMVDHPVMGAVRVDGQPAHFEATDWDIHSAGPVLGQHNDYVFGKILGLSEGEIDDLRAEEVI